ncbi:hypothetical protein AB0C76_35385 [Kitasatospora sp. NPDC048722]|uniref:hypothetical protein n=1 Tax=Kitasatospora sp. NPDC048722 TaxID=3155639 RepID=UPI0033F1E366
MVKIGTDNVLGVSLRQRMTPDDLLGRMNATFRFLLTGALAVGAAVAGAIGQLVGVQPALWVGGALIVTTFVPVHLAPLRRRRDLPPQSEPVDRNASRAADSLAACRKGGG